MAKVARKKMYSFGGCAVNCFSPARAEGWPPAINVVLSFEEALKLQLALQAGLMDINSLNRSTKEGKAAGVNLCIYTDGRLTVNPAKTK